MVAAVNSSTATSGASSSALSATTPQQQQDRFLKLLVAQLNNQDPMNPMDNAQMTTQIAQINTVSGISQLNETIQSMAAQYTSMQIMQGAAMIGHEVVAEGDTLSIDKTKGVGTGAVQLDAAATSVQLQVMTPGGQVIDKVELGAMNAGQHNINWDASKYSGSGNLHFAVVAKQGNSAVGSTPLMRDTIASVGTDSKGAMNLALKSGTSIKYDAIKSIL